MGLSPYSALIDQAPSTYDHAKDKKPGSANGTTRFAAITNAVPG
jgi:hypothetical protein